MGLLTTLNGGTSGQDVCHGDLAAQAVANGWRRPVILSPVELIFTSLLVIVALAVLWFSAYVVYRLFSDQR
nr:hypothetical protein [Kibdelosporangium sp. MJ126-NF4]CTQ93590.1 hypothetical protein [Kibdelosporangium sp. MJ126-NF4]